MRFKIKNLGPIEYADIELGDLTIICGKNNTGKTYIANAIYDFLSNAKKECLFLKEDINTLQTDGNHTRVCIMDYFSILLEKIRKLSESQKFNWLSEIVFEPNELIYVAVFDECTLWQKFRIQKDGFYFLIDNILPCDKSTPFQDILIEDAAAYALNQIFFSSTQGVFMNCFPIVAERAGVAVFKEAVNISNGKLLNSIVDDKLVFENASFKNSFIYNPAIHFDIEFMNKLENSTHGIKTPSFLSHETLLFLDEMAGGEYESSDEGLIYFTPQKGKIGKLPVSKCSTSVKAFLILNFYLKYVAEKNQLMMIDEPELNLHPGNQRRLARLLARLVNEGIKVMVTTHSDYIIKELNTLLLLRYDDPRMETLRGKYNYSNNELLNSEQIRAYEAEDGTLKKLNVLQDSGICIQSFDDEICEMNKIQHDIFFGE